MAESLVPLAMMTLANLGVSVFIVWYLVWPPEPEIDISPPYRVAHY